MTHSLPFSRARWLSHNLAAFAAAALLTHAPASHGQATPGVSATSVKIGGVFPLTGPARLFTEPYERGAKIAFAAVNAEGGVNGRKIDWIIEDDGYQPARTLAGAKKLVERDNVFVLFGNIITPTTKVVMPYAEKEKVPYFTGAPSPVPVSRYTFGLMADYDHVMYQVTKYMIQKTGVKKIGYLYQNDELGAFGRQGVDRALKELGVPLTADVGYERATSDFSTHVLKLRDAGVDGLISMGVAPSTAKAMQQAAGINFKPTWGTFSAGGTGSLQKVLGAPPSDGSAYIANGMIYGSEIDSQSSGSVAVKKVQAVLDKEFPGSMADWETMLGYSHGRLMIEALKAAGPNPTREGLINAIEGKGIDTEGAMAPLTYSTTKRTGASAIAVFQWKNGKAQRVTDWLAIDASKGGK